MATLAEQLESALEGTGSALSASNIEDMLSGTATSIKPGTVTPIASQQSNQQSWNDVFKKISNDKSSRILSTYKILYFLVISS